MEEIKWIYEPMECLIISGDCCACSTNGPDVPSVCQWLTDEVVVVTQ
jgi:hypothetical protein